ncbi:porin [Ferrimonas kyonanensis]|uniref:porin n=1 Tax=Ferrimonas kyonanensis TaxID=364763 RepID=UPI0004810E1F|nr:porin [Ferrimonas kyonanensis]
MKKIALLCLASLASSSALAESPTVYGRMWLGTTYSDNGIASNEKVKGTALESYSSTLGIKGSYDIAPELAVIYKAQVIIQGMDQDKSEDPFKAHNTYLGLKGNFGEVVFGRNDTAFKKLEGGIDQFNITSADMSKLFAGNDRLSDSVNYYSPTLAGVRFGAVYVLEDDFQGSADLNDANNYAVTMTLGDGKLKSTNHYLGLGYADGLNGLKAVRVSAGLKWNHLKLGAIYQDSESLKYTNLEGQSWLLSAAYSISKQHILKAQFGGDDSGLGKLTKNAGASLGDVSDNQSYAYTLGYDYKASKQVTMGLIAAYYDGEFTDNLGKQSFDDTLFTAHLKYMF